MKRKLSKTAQEEARHAIKQSKKLFVFMDAAGSRFRLPLSCLERGKNRVALQETIASGRYGSVFHAGVHAQDKDPSHSLVIKVIPFLPKEYKTLEEYNARFQKECEATASAGQVGLGPKLLDHWQCSAEDKTLISFMLLEFVQGTELAKTPLTKQEAVALRDDLLKRLRSWHTQQRWTHGDIHDRNMLVQPDKKRIWLVDYGQSKKISESDAKTAWFDPMTRNIHSLSSDSEQEQDFKQEILTDLEKDDIEWLVEDLDADRSTLQALKNLEKHVAISSITATPARENKLSSRKATQIKWSLGDQVEKPALQHVLKNPLEPWSLELTRDEFPLAWIRNIRYEPGRIFRLLVSDWNFSIERALQHLVRTLQRVNKTKYRVVIVKML